MGEIKLNPQQQDAVDSIEGALLLLAGAGTGKTRVIVQRIGHMLDSGISSRSILAVTFTNKAAREMRERVAALNGITPDETPLVTTFHSFCNEVLRTHTALAGFKRGFTIATDGYQKGLLRAICSELQLDGNGIDPYSWLAHISLAKANMQGPDEMSRMAFPDAPRVAAIYRRYQERMKRMNLMDFDDLLLYTLQLWETRTDCLAAYRARFKYIMIDEYQDTNRVQLKLMALLAGTDANICAVGDDDQSIYGWRGASQENILSFEEYFPDARVIRLEQNYRSSNMILKAANALISHNPMRREKNLWSERGEGERLRGVRCGDEHAEAEYVSNAIYNMSMRGTSLSSRGRDWRQYAVLYRTGAQSRVLEESFRRRRIPFVVMGSRTFYQRKEILDVLTMLELSLNPANDMAVQRVINVPPRGIGDSLLDRITEQARAGGRSLFAVLCDNDFLGTLPGETAAQLKTFTEAIQRCGRSAESGGAIYPVVNQLLTDIGYEASLIQMYRPRENALERRDNVREFLTGILEYDREANGKGSLEAYLEMIALQDAGDRREKDKDVTENAVNLMTIHASKGLEFPVVFIVGLEQGLFPHQRALDEGGIEEERRLCYVAITRARERVIMTYADKRRILNRVCVKRLSTFLNEIPEEYIEFSSTGDEKMKEASAVNALDYIAQIKARLGNDHQNH